MLKQVLFTHRKHIALIHPYVVRLAMRELYYINVVCFGLSEFCIGHIK